MAICAGRTCPSCTPTSSRRFSGFKPAAVITFGEDGLYWHQDHIGVHERTTTAVQVVRRRGVRRCTTSRCGTGVMRAIVDAAAARGWEPTPRGFWSLTPDAFGLHAAPPTFTVDVADWVPQKLAALRCHQTQMGSGHPFDEIPAADARHWLGVEQFRRASAGTTAGRCSRRSPPAPCYANLRNGYVD